MPTAKCYCGNVAEYFTPGILLGHPGITMTVCGKCFPDELKNAMAENDSFLTNFGLVIRIKEDSLVLRDQPDGDCMSCRWNNSSTDSFHCVCPAKYLVNPICIAKNQIVIAQNIEDELRNKEDEGEDWKNGN